MTLTVGSSYKERRMPTYKLIKNKKVVNVIEADDVFINSIKDDYDKIELYVPPVVEIPTPEPVAKELWTVDDIRSNLTFQERIKWDSDADPAIVTAKLDLRVSQNKQYVEELLNHLVSVKIVSSESSNKILTL